LACTGVSGETALAWMVEVTKFKLVAATNFRAEPFELIDLIASLTGVRPVSSKPSLRSRTKGIAQRPRSNNPSRVGVAALHQKGVVFLSDA